jgi:parallel beta-helix repeat protein
MTTTTGRTTLRAANFARLLARRARLRLRSLEERAVPATYTVNALTDTGTGSGTTGDLRYCIDAADQAAGADTITFDPAVFNSQKTIFVGNHFKISSDMTIIGPASQILILENTASTSTATTRLFTITGGTVSLANLTLLNGSVLGGDGGGVHMSNSTVTLTSVCIDSCIAYNDAGSATRRGGGIYAASGSLTVSGCAIVRNSASPVNGLSYGGGIYSAAATTTLNGVLIEDNDAVFGRGGGIYYDNSAGTLTLQANGGAVTTLKGNDSFYDGGGLHLAAGNANLTAVSVTGNKATTNGRGGGVYVSSTGTVSVTDSTVDGNTAANGGGGIALIGAANTTIASSTISRNKGSTNLVQGGGGVYISGSSCDPQFTQCTISNNTASFGGGGGVAVVSGGILNAHNCTIAVNYDNDDDQGGGGVRLVSGQVALDSTLVANNTSNNKNILSPDISASTITLNYCLVTDDTGIGTVEGKFGNQFDVAAGIGPLAPNGGRTETHAVLSGSAAIDTGRNFLSLDYDQRGNPYLRYTPPTSDKNVNVDIGAYERQNLPSVGNITCFVGTIVSKSVVTSVVVTFDKPEIVIVGDPLDVFVLSRVGTGGGAVSLAKVDVSIGATETKATLTFSKSTTYVTNYGSLTDGRYQLRIKSTTDAKSGTGVLGLDGDQNGTAGDDYLSPTATNLPNSIHRLFGDADMDGDVDAADFGPFRGAFGGSTDLRFDGDGDGDVDANDFILFRTNFGATVP